jgi:hypothetical protein
MTYKNYLLSSILLSSLIISGCTGEKDVIDQEKPAVSEEKPAQGKDEVKDEGTTDKNASSPEVNRDEENDNLSIITSFFDAFNEKDIEKMKTILPQEESLRGFESLFESYDIVSEMISYEVVDSNKGEWLFTVQVKYTDTDKTSDFTDNVSTYNVHLDTNKKIMTALDLENTVEME